MLILKQNTPNSVPTPPAGKGTIFLNTADDLAVKTADGTVTTFPTAGGANTQVYFNDDGTFGATANFTFNKSTNVLAVSGNVSATNVLTNNLLYANGTAWDLSDPGGSNTQIQFNDDESFGGSANFVWDKSSNTLVVTGTSNVNGTFNVAGNITANNVGAGNLLTANFVAGTLTTNAQPNITSVGTLTNVAVTGNATAGNVYANSGTIGASLLTGTLTTSAQPNITSVGTLTTLTTTGNAIIGGNLIVNGNITYVNVENFSVEDPIISIGGGANGAPLTTNDGKDRGTALQYYTSAPVTAFMGWDNGNGEFAFGSNVSISSDVVTYTTLGNVRASTLLGNISGTTGDFTGNITSVNANLGNVSGDRANFTGNISGANANLGNVVTGNYFTGVLTYAAQPNITSVGTLTSLQIGATSDKANDFPSATTISSQDNTGDALSAPIGLVGEAVANSSGNVQAFGLYGVARANGAAKGTGVQGTALVTNTADTGAAVGVRGYATTTHAGGYNIGVLGNAIGSGVGNYAFYVQNGGIASIENTTFWDLTDNSNAALTFNSTGKANIFGIETTDNAEGIFTSGYLNVTGNVSAGGVKTNNLYYANGNPWDLQQAGGSNTQVQFNDADGFGGSAAFTFDKTSNLVSMGGALSVTGNANVGNIGATNGVFTNVSGNGSSLTSITGANVTGTVATATTAGTVTTAAQPNITSVGTLSSLTASGNVTGGNLVTAGKVYASEMLNGGTGVYLSAGPSGYINFFTTGGDKATISDSGNIVASNLVANSTVFATTANISGNVNAGNVGATNGVFTNVSGNGSALTSITGANVTGQVGNALVAGTVYTAAQPNITSVGTLTSLSVTGNISAGNVSATTFTGALSGAATTAGTVTTNAQPNITSVGTLSSVAVTGNATAGNVYANSGTIGASLLTGTLTTAAQPNITSTGTLTSLTVTGTTTAGNLSTGGTLSVTGNANVGNLGTAGLITASGNVSGGNLTTGGLVNATGNIVSGANVVTDLIVGKTSSVTITATGTNQNINLTPTGTGTVNVGNFIISNVAEPVADTDAATKKYVDDVAQGLHTHDSCNAATQTTLATISGGTITYNNGTAGVGATLTTTGTFTTIDGVTLSNGMRILVKNEATAANNGIYVRTSATVLTRADDFNTPAEMAGGDFTFVTAGTLYDNTGWVMTDPVTTVGTTPVVWVQFSGAGTYTAGTGLTLTGSEFSISNTTVAAGAYGNGDYNATFTVNGQGQLTAAANVAITANAGNLSGTTLKSTVVNSSLTSVGTLGSLAVTGNISAGNVSATTFTGALSGAATTAGTVTTAAQPNITSVGTLSSLTVSGNASAGNLNTAGAVVASTLTSNVTTGTAPLTVTSTTRVSNLNVAYANVADNINVAAGTGNNFLIFASAATGNVSEVTSTGLTANLSNNSITATTFVGAVSGNGAAITDLNASNVSTGTLAQARLANASVTLGSTALTLGSTVTTVAGLTSVTSTTFVGALTGAATSATTAGTVTTAAQPNITSVGTLTSVAVTGNVTAGNIIAGAGAGGNITGANLVSANFFTGTLTTAAQPNITSVGTLTSLTTTTITTGANSTAGSMTGNWTLTAGSRFNATYADLAERYVADMPYEPGTVVVFAGEYEVSITGEADSTRVAGVVSTNPAYLMNSECEGEHVVDLALIGRVPVRVQGPVNKGDLLVTSEISGFAKANNEARAGTIIGKALENFNGPTPDGLIEVLVGRS